MLHVDGEGGGRAGVEDPGPATAIAAPSAFCMAAGCGATGWWRKFTVFRK
jgi:hypothetical protein